MTACGEQIEVRDWQGSTAARFIWVCCGESGEMPGKGHYLMTARDDPRNGLMLFSWTEVLHELVRRAAPEHRSNLPADVAEARRQGPYTALTLTYPLSVGGLAALLAVSRDEVRTELADLAIVTRA